MKTYEADLKADLVKIGLKWPYILNALIARENGEILVPDYGEEVKAYKGQRKPLRDWGPSYHLHEGVAW